MSSEDFEGDNRLAKYYENIVVNLFKTHMSRAKLAPNKQFYDWDVKIDVKYGKMDKEKSYADVAPELREQMETQTAEQVFQIPPGMTTFEVKADRYTKNTKRVFIEAYQYKREEIAEAMERLGRGLKTAKDVFDLAPTGIMKSKAKYYIIFVVDTYKFYMIPRMELKKMCENPDGIGYAGSEIKYGHEYFKPILVEKGLREAFEKGSPRAKGIRKEFIEPKTGGRSYGFFLYEDRLSDYLHYWNRKGLPTRDGKVMLYNFMDVENLQPNLSVLVPKPLVYKSGQVKQGDETYPTITPLKLKPVVSQLKEQVGQLRHEIGKLPVKDTIHYPKEHKKMTTKETQERIKMGMEQSQKE